jgi:hypothetical protein
MLLVVALGLAAGCTTLPSKQFATYKETFSEARKAGEDVLLDYGAAAAQYAEAQAKRAAAQPRPNERDDKFDAQAVVKQTVNVDHVAVRMKAWDVVARYNDLLTALAEGKPADELAGAVDGLSASLGSFPVADVALSWTQISGYLAPLKPLALEAVREQSRRKFVQAVGQGGPLITDNFLKLLKEDAGNFYQVRFGLNEREYRPAVTEVADTRNRAARLAAPFQPTAEVEEVLSEVNACVSSLPRRSDGSPAVKPIEPQAAGGSPPAPTAEALVQLKSLQAECATRAARALALHAELRAYRDVLTRYVQVLNQLDMSMRALQVAAEQAQPAVPQGAELEHTVILLRQAYITYKDMRKE